MALPDLSLVLDVWGVDEKHAGHVCGCRKRVVSSSQEMLVNAC